MRIAALYDIHGNLPALEAVLRDVRDAEADHVVVGGDIVPGPMVREVLACLLALPLPVRFITGNCETALFREIDGEPLWNLPAGVRESLRSAADQLHPEEVRFLRTWPNGIRLDIPDLGAVLFCHATPRDDNEIVTVRTPAERLAPLLDAAGASVVVCGHTHMQFDRMVGATRFVNAGSVGMPFGEPGAYWLLLGPGIELRKTNYDREDAAARIRATSYPQAAEFADRYVLHPPTETEMLDLFSRAELK